MTKDSRLTSDSYNTIEKPSFAEFKDRGSRFIAYAFPISDVNDFKEQLEKNGLCDIEIKEISLKIAPSVSYVPWTCVKFFVKEILKNRSLRMKRERWHNVYAPVLGMILGLYRKHFGYYIISGRKEVRGTK